MNDHRLTLLGGQTKLRHPQGCDVTLCEIDMAVEISTSISHFRDGLYSVDLTSKGLVHLTEIRPRRELVS